MTFIGWFLAAYFFAVNLAMTAVTFWAIDQRHNARLREAEALDRLDALHVSLHGRCASRAECAATCSQLEGLRWQLLELEHPQPADEIDQCRSGTAVDADSVQPPRRPMAGDSEAVLMIANLVAPPQPEEAA